MRPISLVLLLVDAHTPAEPAEVIQHTVARVLRPLVATLERYQQVRVSLALSGALGEWLEKGDAELVERLRGLVARKQLEPIAVAHHGAVLHAIPFRDAVDQVERNVAWQKRVLGARARGAWLAGGAWDGMVPRILSRAGLQYAFCDDALVRAARDTGERSLGWYVAEREAGAIGIIPLDRRLADFVPWSEPPVVAAELQNRARAGDRVLAVQVPLTDLGLRQDLQGRFWDPTKGYVLRLSKMLTGQSSWLKMQLAKEVLKETRPSGRVAPLAGTPLESGIGALPVEQASRLQKLQEIVDRDDDPVLRDAAPWLVGPPFEAFLGRYVEANRIHKHVLRSSGRLDSARRKHKGAQTTIAQLAERLSQAQSATALADTPSGGIYRGDLRHAAWSRIAEVDHALDELDGTVDGLFHKSADFDCDGVPEIAVSTPMFGAVVTPAQGGALTELLVWGVGNVCNTFTRYPELWHDDLARWSSMPMIVGAQASEDHEAAEVVVDDDPEVESTEELSRHPIQAVAQTAPVRPRLPAIVPGLDRLIVHDRVPRATLIDHFFGEPLTLENLQRDQYPEIGDFAREPYQLQAAEDVSLNETRVSVAREGTVRQADQHRLVRVYKQYRFYKELPEIDVEVVVSNRYHEPVRATFGIEVNLNLDSLRGPSRFLVVPGRERMFLESMGEITDATSLALVLADRGLQLTVEAQPAARIFYYPIETPLRTWRGYASAYQGTCVLLTWKLELWGQEKQTFGVRLKADRT